MEVGDLKSSNLRRYQPHVPKEFLEAPSTPCNAPGSASNVSSTTAETCGPTTDRSRSRRSIRILGSTVSFLKQQWFLIALGCVIAIASQVQVPASHQETKEIIVTYLAVSIIFFITGCTLPTNALLRNYSRWNLHIYVQAQCFLMTSSIVFAIVSASATNPDFMDPGLLVGLIFSSSLATTISSNVIMTGQANGNQALTVVQSTLGNFLAPFLSPLLIKLYVSTGAWYTKVLPESSDGYNLLYRRVFKQLGLSIFVPLVAGQIVRNLFPTRTAAIFAKFKLSKISSFCLLLIIWQTYDESFRSRAFTSVKSSNIIFIVFISLAFLVVFTAISFLVSIIWLPKEDTIAVCYCVPAKALAMGVPLAHVMFVGLTPQMESKLQIPMVLYQAIQVGLGSLLIGAFRAWKGPEAECNRRDEET